MQYEINVLTAFQVQLYFHVLFLLIQKVGQTKMSVMGNVVSSTFA